MIALTLWLCLMLSGECHSATQEQSFGDFAACEAEGLAAIADERLAAALKSARLRIAGFTCRVAEE